MALPRGARPVARTATADRSPPPAAPPLRFPPRATALTPPTPAASLLHLRRHRRLDLPQLVAQLPRPPLQLLLQPLPHLLGVGRLRLLHVRHPVAHQVVDDPPQLVRRRRDRLGRPQPTPLPPQV